MSRVLPVLIGILVLVTTGLVHGWWTDRWHPSNELLQATQRLNQLPTQLGDWKSEEHLQDPQVLEMAGAVGHYSRTFVDPRSGSRVLVILLVGKAARMAVHRPEHCYTAAGYRMTGSPIQVKIQPNGHAVSEFDTALFTRDDPGGPNQMRIFWSFGSSHGWSVPSSPRWKFAQERVLYKLYVLRNVAGDPGPIIQDPCIQVLGELLPAFERTLPAEPKEV